MKADRWLVSLARREDGNFTLEASMVFPVLFIALIGLLMLSMYTYQKVVLYHSASLASERTAFRWDNSARDPLSGIAPTGQYDGLYWRLTDNGALKALFDFGSDPSGEQGIELAIGSSMSRDAGNGAGDDVSDTTLPMRKMKAEAARVANAFSGSMRYGGLVEKKLEVKLRQPIRIPPLEWFLGHSEPATAGSASIVDPVELIRNVDLARYYTGKFKGGLSGDKREQAQQILAGRQAPHS
ncbi:pilus assembly protein [Paenibacillus lycopersici]|uniref:Pilus assembly protein n=1 Tax=Paenibacillus lycopersici TaxID=2704462 RepID=A0A6C0G045_9BACL|nr:TadE/TadG family type IV pilus assembly protein [Paenibacillus lycopersici]QHT62788.1 pilus assembly protein [Paenibacillus lycopersici]